MSIVESVNVGEPRAVEVNGHTVWTAIWKSRSTAGSRYAA